MTVLDACLTRRSIRAYSDRPIPLDVERKLVQALWSAPSGSNLQPWQFVFVTRPAAREEIGKACLGRMFIAEAPLIVVGLAYPQQAHRYADGRGNTGDTDVTIAMTQLMLVAAEEGLGTCWVGALQESLVKKVIAAPADSRVIACMPVGYPQLPNAFTIVAPENRKRESQIIVREKFQ